jgi:hypothetical protein
MVCTGSSGGVGGKLGCYFLPSSFRRGAVTIGDDSSTGGVIVGGRGFHFIVFGLTVVVNISITYNFQEYFKFV